jgi:hypothetical protein
MEWTNQRLASPDPWMERIQRIQKRDSRGTVVALGQSPVGSLPALAPSGNGRDGRSTVSFASGTSRRGAGPSARPLAGSSRRPGSGRGDPYFFFCSSKYFFMRISMSVPYLLLMRS